MWMLSTKSCYGFKEVLSAQFMVLMEADMGEVADESRNWGRMIKRRRRKCMRLIKIIVKFTA